MKITKEKVDLLIHGSRDERKFACAKAFKLFAIFYFTKYFAYKSAPFHDDFFDDFQALASGELKDAAWIAFRESAKTSIAKMGLTWLIARKQVIDELTEKGHDMRSWLPRLYVTVDSYDKENAEAILFDVVTELQSNGKLIDDFGHLYNQPRSKDQVTQKRVSNFITTNGIRVEAHTALTSMRGRLFQNYRPDFVLRDDLETEITAASPATTQKIIKILDEAKGGMAAHGASLTLGNFIVEEGTMGYVRKSVTNSGGRVRFIPVQERDGTITWPEKYVATDADALEANKAISDRTRHKISLESKKREMNAGGNRVFEVDMLLDPVAAGAHFFDRDKIDEALTKAKAAKEDRAGFLLWEAYNPAHAYAIGADVGKGNGRDHSASVAIDFSTIPGRVIGSYANNQISADLFAHELKRQGDILGTCLLAPEKNAEAGGSCLTTLKIIYPIAGIYQQVPFDRASDKPLGSLELGWETNGATKYMILNDLKTAVESGQLAIFDERILKELRAFTYSDADELGKTRQGLSTRHFDLLMATAIAWHMRKHAQPKSTGPAYEQQPYEQPGFTQ